MRTARTTCFLLVWLLALTLTPAQPTSAAIASGFSLSPPLLSFISPTAIAFTPDESLLLITTKVGLLYLADVSADGHLSLRQTPALDLRAKLCTERERGLVGVVADRQFATNRSVYLYYTYHRDVPIGDRCRQTELFTPIDWRTPMNRLSRFTVGPDGIIDPAGERVLLDSIPSPTGIHSGGDLHFGADSYLYISIGDGGCDYAGGLCTEGNDAARDANVLLGKIVRIIPNPDLPPDMRIPPANPYAANGTVCALDGHGPAGTPISTPCKETFATGLRNPFRMAFDPNTTAPTTRFFINDVGESAWEEINLGEAGADYRWNQCEGSYVNSTQTRCPAPTGVERNPIYEYSHDTSCTSITAGAIVPNGVWPYGYGGHYLFSDYACGKIFVLHPDAPQHYSVFADKLGSIVGLTFGPGPNTTRALYYVDIGSGGILRLVPDAPGNRAPVAAVTATPQFGEITVTFDGSASADPDDDVLTYIWSFGNGEIHETTIPTTTYIYPAEGRYTARLQVRDTSGTLSNSATILIDTLNGPPAVAISLSSTTFAVDDTITLSASATDIQDGPLPSSAFSWEIIRHHRASQPGAHTHPFFGPVTGASVSLTAPEPEDFEAASNSYLEVHLTVTDSGGAWTKVSADLLPEKVTLVFQTEPAGMVVTVNGAAVPDGVPVISWRNYTLHLAGLPQRSLDGTWRALSGWDDGSTTTLRTIMTPTTPTTYTATFDREATVVYLPLALQP